MDPSAPLPAGTGPTTHRARALRTQVITTCEALSALREPWAALWERAPGRTPFSHPAWLLAWCRHLAERPPIAVAVWCGRDLACLVPSFAYEDARGRVLALLGGRVSDYQDVIGDGVDAVVIGLACAVDAARADAVDLQSVPSWSLVREALAVAAVRHRVAGDGVCPVLSLPARLEDLLPRASRRLLDDVVYQRRRLAREGGLEVRRATGEAVDEALSDIRTLHRLRWEGRGDPGVLEGAAVLAFHREAAHGLDDARILRLLTLRTAGRPIAALYGFSTAGRTYGYLHGFDPNESRRSPGTLAFAQAIEDAMEEGAHEFDFLRGTEPYKARWGAVGRSTLRVRWTDRHRGRAAPGRNS